MKDVNSEEEEPVVEEDSSSPVDEQEVVEDQEEEVVDDGQEKSKHVPYDRFREVNEKQKALKAELETAQKELESLKTPAKDEVSEQELASKYAKDPVGFVREVVKRTKGGDTEELKAVRQQLQTLRSEQRIALARARYADFKDYENDISDMIKDGTAPIDLSKDGALDWLYQAAKSRRNSAKSKKTSPSDSSVKVPHTESASKKSKLKSKKPEDMSLEELEKAIGVAERKD